jgi:hypothetical protein
VAPEPCEKSHPSPAHTVTRNTITSRGAISAKSPIGPAWYKPGRPCIQGGPPPTAECARSNPAVAAAASALRSIPSASVAPATTGSPGRGGDDGEIGYERVELAVRAGVEGNLKALLQLPDEQAPFSGSGPQTLDDLLAVAVGSAERMPTRHIFSLARPTLSDPRLTGDRLAAASDGSG